MGKLPVLKSLVQVDSSAGSCLGRLQTVNWSDEGTIGALKGLTETHCNVGSQERPL